MSDDNLCVKPCQTENRWIFHTHTHTTHTHTTHMHTHARTHTYTSLHTTDVCIFCFKRLFFFGWSIGSCGRRWRERKGPSACHSSHSTDTHQGTFNICTHMDIIVSQPCKPSRLPVSLFMSLYIQQILQTCGERACVCVCVCVCVEREA